MTQHSSPVTEQATNDLIAKLMEERDDALAKGAALFYMIPEKVAAEIKLGGVQEKWKQLLNAHAQSTPWQEALQQIKNICAGDRVPNWKDDWQTTHSRGRILDICDFALSTLTSTVWCSCKASQRDGQHMAWCPALTSTQAHAQSTLERLPVEKLAKHFAVSVAQAQAAQDDIGFMYRELASPVTSTVPKPVENKDGSAAPRPDLSTVGKRNGIKQQVVIDYTNWRGERGLRRIVPHSIRFENNEWHPETQWLLEASDVEKGEIRTFAVVNIHSWYRHVPFALVGGAQGD